VAASFAVLGMAAVFTLAAILSRHPPDKGFESGLVDFIAPMKINRPP
jgi:hypothetical protein